MRLRQCLKRRSVGNDVFRTSDLSRHHVFRDISRSIGGNRAKEQQSRKNVRRNGIRRNAQG